jgi:hypothetical protein
MAEPAGGVKLPGVGHVSKKWVVIVAVASAGSIGWFVYRRKQSAAAAPATASSVDASSADQVDPATGDVAGSAQDQMDLASLQSGGGYGDYAGGGYYAGQGSLGVSGVTPPVPGSGGFTTNGQWSQQAEQDLGGLGISEVTLSAALGHYLTARQLTPAQQSLVDQAIAEEGYPPVAGAGGYPPAMHTQSTGSGSTGGGSSGKPTKTVEADGRQTLQQVAVANHVTEAQVTLWNKDLAKYIGTGRDLPKGTKVHV